VAYDQTIRVPEVTHKLQRAHGINMAQLLVVSDHEGASAYHPILRSGQPVRVQP